MTDRSSGVSPRGAPANQPGDEVVAPQTPRGSLSDGRTVVQHSDVDGRNELHHDMLASNSALSHFDRALTEPSGPSQRQVTITPSPSPSPSPAPSPISALLATISELSPDLVDTLKALVEATHTPPRQSDVIVVLAYHFMTEAGVARTQSDFVEMTADAFDTAKSYYREAESTVRHSLVEHVPDTQLDNAVRSATEAIVFNLLSTGLSDGGEEKVLQRTIEEFGRADGSLTSSSMNSIQSNDENSRSLGKLPEAIRNSYVTLRVTAKLEKLLYDYPPDLRRSVEIDTARLVRAAVQDGDITTAGLEAIIDHAVGEAKEANGL